MEYLALEPFAAVGDDISFVLLVKPQNLHTIHVNFYGNTPKDCVNITIGSAELVEEL